jgi:hypothetical protein
MPPSETKNVTRSFTQVCYLNHGPCNEGPEVEIYCPAEVGALLKTHDLAKKDNTEMRVALSVFASGHYCSLTM